MRGVMNLFVLIAVGVIIADLANNIGGTNALFSGISNLWTTSVNGMLGKGTNATSTA